MKAAFCVAWDLKWSALPYHVQLLAHLVRLPSECTGLSSPSADALSRSDPP